MVCLETGVIIIDSKITSTNSIMYDRTNSEKRAHTS